MYIYTHTRFDAAGLEESRLARDPVPPGRT